MRSMVEGSGDPLALLAPAPVFHSKIKPALERGSLLL